MSVRNYPLYAAENIRDLKELTDRSIRLYAKSDAIKVLTDTSEFRSVTYSQFGDDLCALANSLINLGLTGHRIALIGENSCQWVLSYLTIVNSNMTAVPLDKELKKEEILSSTVAFCPSVKQLPVCMELFWPTSMILVPLYLETFNRRIWEGAKKQGKEIKLKIRNISCFASGYIRYRYKGQAFS